MNAVTNVFELLANAVDAHAERIAIDFGDATIRYTDLIDRSERFATRLREAGAAPGARVAHAFTKSIDALVALFAIARTGAAYVPIDPAWPADRIAKICEDAGAVIWTGTRSAPGAIATRMRSTFASQVDGADAVAIESTYTAPRITGAPPTPDRGVANLLFTSGSTGGPKGVEITTLSLDHFSRWGEVQFALTPDDRVANHAPFNFDLSTFDIFAAVRVGATMCPVPERVKMFPYPLAKFIADQRISIWYSVPSALVMLQLRGKLGDHDLSALRHVIFAGEVMPIPALRSLAELIPHAAWTNLYGPTETNVCTYHPVNHKVDMSAPTLPIGLPISDTRVWIVDEDLQDVAAPGAGELLVAGPTVTTGYANDAEMTARRLVPAPDGVGMAYRTGDRVRRRADGALLFEGRIDRMIKCRGHRIEPGEIETALLNHPSVREAAIVAVADPVFGNRLRACVSFRDALSLTQADLIAHCRANVPAYMVPDEWDIRDALPQTDRGKVDLRALADET
ncbi:MAG TPA: amino acid adenylation domain-containing protein [Phycisphaerae bacterium]|nr:amino acid adenylation domain-containing protein [Phycisphaerae bacterium]HRW53499.1 amino acid adenylation domain-containing protein [Phycisphaerae bacterium]